LDFDGNNVRVIPLGFDRCTGNIVQNNTIHDVAPVSGGALVSAGSTGNQYLNNTITNTANDSSSAVRGMWLGNGGSQAETSAYIANNTLRNIGATAIVVQGYTATILNNLAEDVTGAGIKIVPADGAVGVQRIEGNTMRRCSFHGLQVDDQTSKVVNSVVIKNNWFEENVHTGMYLASTLTNSMVDGNTVMNNHRTGVQGWEGGILIFGANNLTVQNNRIYDTNPAGSPRQDIGIQVSAAGGNVQALQISNNYISNNSMFGVVVQDSAGWVSGVTYSGSTITNNAQDGIRIQENSSNAINNIVYNNGCFAGNGIATIYDNRGGRALAAPAGSFSCTDPTGGGTTPPTTGGTTPPPTTGGTTPPPVPVTPPPSPSPASSVTINAYGSPSGGVYPHMELRLGTTVLSAWDVTGKAQNYTYSSSNSINAANLRVYFTNDGYDATSDRNLFVNSLSLNATTYQTNASNVYAAGCTSGYLQTIGLYCNGYFEYPTQAASTVTSNTVIISAYGSPSGGLYPHMELRLGTTVLNGWDVTGSAQNYTYSTTSPINTGKLQVYFTNDAYDATSDRNLFVNSLTLNGTTYQTNASNVYSADCSSGYLQTIGLYCNGYFEYPTV
jgi:hypothetical protein